MASQNIIDLGFSVDKVEAEKARIIAAFDEVLNKAKQVTDLKLSFGGATNLGDFTKANDALKQYTDLLKKSEAQQLANARAAKELAAAELNKSKAQTEAVKQSKLQADIDLKYQKQNDQTVKQIVKEEKAISDLSNDYKQLSIAYNDAALKAKNLALQQGSNTPAAKAALEEARILGDKLKEVDYLTGSYTRNVGNYSSAFTGYANTLRSLRGPTKLLGEALGIGATEADQFRLVLEHAFQGIAAFFRGKEAKAAATVADNVATATNTTQTVANTVATEGAAVAQTELAVATTGASTAMKAFRIAMLATGIGVVIGLIAMLVVKVIEHRKALEDAARAQKDLNEALDSSSYKEAVTSVNKLTEEIKLAKEGFLDKKEVLNEYNNTIGKTTGEVKSLDEAEQALVKNGDAYIKMMLYKAAANVALEEAAKKAVEAEKLHIKNREEFSKTLVDTRISGGGAGGLGSGAFNAKEFEEDEKRRQYALAKRKSAAIQEQKDASKAQLDIANKFTEDAAKIAKNFHFDFFGGEKDSKAKKEKAAKDLKDYFADALKAQKEGDKLYFEAQTELYKSIYTNEKEGYGERLDALASYHATSLKMLENQKGDELKIIDEKTKEDLNKHGLTEGQRADILKTQSAERLKVENEYLKNLQKLRLDDAKEELSLREKMLASMQHEEFKSTDQRAKEQYDAQQRNVKDRLDADELFSKRRQTQIQIDAANEERILLDKYNSGLINRKEYEASLLDIQRRSSVDLLNEQIKTVEDELKVANLDYETRKDLELKLANLRLSLSTSQGKQQIEAHQKLVDAEKKLASELVDTFQSIVEAGYEREKNALADLQKQKDDYYAKEIENIQNSTLSEQDKAAKVAVLKAEQEAQDKQIENRKREVEQREARFARAMQIATIIATTAQAVIAALAPPPIGLGPVAGVPLAAVTGAIGAAQIAAILAKPIPRYAEGTLDHRGGYALFGEAGAELVKEPGKAPYVVDIPTVGSLPIHTKVMPINSDHIDEIMHYGMMQDTARILNSRGTQNDPNTALLKGIHSELRKQKAAKMSVNIYNDAEFTAWVRKNVKGG
jgi:hypothetical protein